VIRAQLVLAAILVVLAPRPVEHHEVATALQYEQARDWPKLPANVELGEVAGVDVERTVT